MTLWEASVKFPSLYPALTATWVVVTFFYPCIHGPTKQTYWHCSWPLAALTTALKSLMANQLATFEWTTSDQYAEFKPFWESCGELVPSSGNTRRTWWQRYPSGVYAKFPQYHWLSEMESVDTCWCDHRWYCNYQEEHKIFPGSLSISDRPYCVSMMPNIPIGKCVNQA